MIGEGEGDVCVRVRDRTHKWGVGRQREGGPVGTGVEGVRCFKLMWVMMFRVDVKWGIAVKTRECVPRWTRIRRWKARRLMCNTLLHPTRGMAQRPRVP